MNNNSLNYLNNVLLTCDDALALSCCEDTGTIFWAGVSWAFSVPFR